MAARVRDLFRPADEDGCGHLMPGRFQVRKCGLNNGRIMLAIDDD
jgi:hypothetical protein